MSPNFCPLCSSELQPVSNPVGLGQVEICQKGDGAWLVNVPLLEFAKTLPRSSVSQPNSHKEYLFVGKVKVLNSHQLQEAKRLCPGCHQAMEKFNYAYDSNIFLDQCLSCRGVWADTGELERVAPYSKSHVGIAHFSKHQVSEIKNQERRNNPPDWERDLEDLPFFGWLDIFRARPKRRKSGFLITVLALLIYYLFEFVL